jgi:NAD(P)-dependent dehydrogenase (short-subunit alcohol dehydrogenase family)
VQETGFTRGEVRLVDLLNFKSVTSFADAFEAEHERLDILVCNAGMFSPDYEVSADGHELV